MKDAIKFLELEQMRSDLPRLLVGDTLKVYVRIKEGDKERIQAFEGVCIRKTGGLTGATFTVRKVSYGVGVERTFASHSPTLERIDVLQHGKVRRARLYYLRQRVGKAARIKEKRLPQES
jgi:large subunit ribosomal protein L19